MFTSISDTAFSFKLTERHKIRYTWGGAAVLFTYDILQIMQIASSVTSKCSNMTFIQFTLWFKLSENLQVIFKDIGSKVIFLIPGKSVPDH